MELHEALKNTIEEEGIKILNEYRLIYILTNLEVFTDQPPIYRGVMSIIVRDKLLKGIVYSKNLEEEYEKILSSTSDKLVNDYGFKQEIVNVIISQIWKTFSLMFDTNKSDEELLNEECNYSCSETITDKWGGEYSKDGIAFLKMNAMIIKEYKIKEGTKVICGGAFESSYWLETIEIPSSVKIIDYYAFFICESLKSINIPDSVTKIGTGAFSSCRSLRSVHLPNSLKTLESHLFDGCSYLQYLEIPDTVTSIEEYAFEDCSSLDRINIPKSVESIQGGVFIGCNLEIETESSQFYSDGYCLIDLNSDCLIGCHKRDVQDYSIPDSIKIIEFCAFMECTSLQNIIIPESVEKIGASAFNKCESIQEIRIPSNVKNLEYRTFYGCSSLRMVELPHSLTKIGTEAFSECSSLQNIILHHSLTTIEDEAFSECTSLQSIAIPNSVISIGKNVFKKCKSLRRIYIPKGTYSRFEKMLAMYKSKLVEI